MRIPIIRDSSLTSIYLVIEHPVFPDRANGLRCYVAGPMSGYPEFNFAAFDDATLKLRMEGWQVISPAEMDRRNLGFDPAGMTGKERMPENGTMYARQDLTALLTVDAVMLLPGWEDSKGANNEAMIATMLGVPCFTYVDRNRVEFDVHFSNASTPHPDETLEV